MTGQQRSLAEYAARGSEQAFRGLVGSYINLCNATALRLVKRAAHPAEDVTGGLIDEPRVWNRARSELGVAFLFASRNRAGATGSAAK